VWRETALLFSVSFGFFDWTCEFRDFTDAFGVGGVRARNKCSADFRSVPARFNAKEGCFGGSDVSVHEFLHCRSFVFIELLGDAADALNDGIREDRKSMVSIGSGRITLPLYAL
jgi:hypothetical protein